MADLKYNSWDEAYSALKDAGLSEDRIPSILEKKGYAKEETKSDIPEKQIPVINKYTDSEGKEKTYDEVKAKEGAEKFDELVGGMGEDKEEYKLDPEDDTSSVWNKLTATALGTAGTLALRKKLLEKFGADSLKELLKVYGPDLVKYVKTAGGGKLLKSVPVIAAIVDEAISLHGVDKALTDGSIGGTGNGWKDAGQAVAANIEGLWGGDVSDSRYANKGEDKEKAKEKQKSNKVYRDLGGNFWSNLTGIEALEGGYLKEEKRIKKELGDKAVQDADRQISAIVRNAGGDLSPESVAEFKKDIIKQGYKYQKITDKKGNSTYTWVKDGKPLINELKKK